MAHLEATLAAVTGTNVQTTIIGEAPEAGRVTGVSFTPNANITGDNTNTRTLTLTNKGADGNGTTAVASLAYVTGKDSTDYNEEAFTLNATAANRVVAAGDILAVVETVGASGLNNPGGLVQVEIGASRYTTVASSTGQVIQTES